MKLSTPLILFLCICSFLLFMSCTPKPVDITLYVMLEDARFIDSVVKQYNRSQRRFKVEYRLITPDHLEAVLINKMQRRNIFMLAAPHQISKRGNERFFVSITPSHSESLGINRLNDLAVEALTATQEYGMPLYFYDVKNERAQVATLSLVSAGYNPQFSTMIADWFTFLSQPQVNAQGLMFQKIPVYVDSGLSALPEKSQEAVDMTAFPNGFVTDELLPEENLEIAP